MEWIMKKAIKRTAAVILLLLLAAPGQLRGERRPMSLVIMFDGLRVDAPENLNMINYTMLRKGQWHPDYRALFADNCRTVPDALPSSASNHASIVTGVNASTHKISSNRDLAAGRFGNCQTYPDRLIEAGKIRQGAFCYQWAADDKIPMGKKVMRLRCQDKSKNCYQKDEYSVNRLLAMLGKPDTPETLLLFIDSPDSGGHRGQRINGLQHGFYPYGKEYIYSAAISDWWLGKILTALQQRPTFSQEDWLIILCSDHGGLGNGHGPMAEVMGRTTPLLVVSRHIPRSGKMLYMPTLMDIAPAVLAHHGMDTNTLALNGKGFRTTVRQEKKRKLSEDLLYYLPFDTIPFKNHAGHAETVFKNGRPALVPGCAGNAADFKKDGGFLQLIRSGLPVYENKDNFTVTFWLRCSVPGKSDAVIFSNKDLKNNSGPGTAFLRRTQTKPADDFYLFSIGSAEKSGIRRDLYKLHPVKGKWLFFALTKQAGNTLLAVQGLPDGHLYWMAEDCSGTQLFTSLPWTINPNGASPRQFHLDFQMDEFALWTRSLDLSDLRKIFQAGRSGISLEHLLRK